MNIIKFFKFIFLFAILTFIASCEEISGGLIVHNDITLSKTLIKKGTYIAKFSKKSEKSGKMTIVLDGRIIAVPFKTTTKVKTGTTGKTMIFANQLNQPFDLQLDVNTKTLKSVNKFKFIRCSQKVEKIDYFDKYRTRIIKLNFLNPGKRLPQATFYGMSEEILEIVKDEPECATVDKAKIIKRRKHMKNIL